MSKTEMEETIVSMLGGRAAEQLILNDMTRTYIDYYNLKSYYTYKFNEKEAYWEEYDIYI